MKVLMLFFVLLIGGVGYSQMQIPKSVADGMKPIIPSFSDNIKDTLIVRANVIDTTNLNGKCFLWRDMFLSLEKPSGRFLTSKGTLLEKKFIVVSYYVPKNH